MNESRGSYKRHGEAPTAPAPDWAEWQYHNEEQAQC